MSFVSKIVSISERTPDLLEHIQTEEATKNALIMPFIAALGWDVFNPKEVIPEFTADVGTKKGEKVDYAIRYNDEVVMLIECKKTDVELSSTEMSQLYRYFTTTNARIGVLTNGIQYRFFSDLDEPNKMDTIPFMEIDLNNIKENLLERLSKITKENFDLQNMLNAANELKYTNAIKGEIARVLDDPDDDFVKYFFYKVSAPGARFAGSVKDFFPEIVRKAFKSFISDRISDRLRQALQSEVTPPTDEEEIPEDGEKDGVVTTEQEIEGFHIVKAIVRDVMDPEKITYRDTKSYMGILYDDNNRKPICRLHFNFKQKYIGLVDEQKNETRMPIDNLNDIYNYEEQLKRTAKFYEDTVNLGETGKHSVVVEGNIE